MARTKQSAGLGPRRMLTTFDNDNTNNANNNPNDNNQNIKPNPKQTPQKKSTKTNQIKKPHRFKPGQAMVLFYKRPLSEVRRYQKSTELLIKRRPFDRVIKEVAQSLEHVTAPTRFQKTACEALQEVTEAYLVGLLMDANLLALHAGRLTLKKSDLQLAKKIKDKQDVVQKNINNNSL